MSVYALPAPFFRGSAFQFDDAGGFPAPAPLTPNFATGRWTIGTFSGVDDAQLAPVAEAIERLIQQDFDLASEFTTILIDAANGAPSFSVVLGITADLPANITVGSQAPFSVGKAASLAALIRSIPGHGVQWTP